jgi:Zn-dependent protease
MIEQFFIILIQVASFLLAISVHESAHAYSAYRMGDPTAYYMGRVTLNPIPHIDLIGSILLPVIGIFSGFIIGWAKPCPVNPYNFKNPRRDNMIVSFAGPFSNILLAAIAALIFAVLSNIFLLHDTFAYLFFSYFVFINLLLAFFNLIPIPPLDGSWILEGLMPSSWFYAYQRIKPYGFLILLVLVFMGVLRFVLVPVVDLFFKLFTLYWR